MDFSHPPSPVEPDGEGLRSGRRARDLERLRPSDRNLPVGAPTSTLTDVHADTGVSTPEGRRGRGLATAAASLVVRRVRDSGRVPVWSTGEDNLASLRVARKLGFEERFRRTYVIPGAGNRGAAG